MGGCAPSSSAYQERNMSMKRLVRIMLLTVLFALLAASAAQALTIYGTSDPDEIDCCSTNDTIYVFEGGDDVNSEGGDDSVYGGGGKDWKSEYVGGGKKN